MSSEFSERNPIFQKNLSLFLSRYPTHQAAVADALKSKDFSSLKIEKTSDGLHLFQDTQLIDSTAPSFFEPFPKILSDVKVLVMGGFGMGVFLQRYLERAPLPEEVILFEPSLARFLFALGLTDFSTILADSRFHWLIGSDYQNDIQFFKEKFSDDRFLKAAASMQWLNHPVIEALEGEYFKSIKYIYTQLYAFQKKSLGFTADSLVGIRYVFENLEWIRKTPGIDRLRQKFKDVSCIIASTGPSLHKSLDHLRRIQDRVMILSCDASLKILLKNGIQPHFVFSIEREKELFDFYAGISTDEAKAHLVAFPFIPQKVLDAYPGPQWVAYRNYDYFGFFENQWPRGILGCGPSVAHMALIFADSIGAKEVFLIGQDLAYDPDSFTSHADGTPIEGTSTKISLDELQKKVKARGEEFLFVPGNLREQVPTSSYYWVFADIFREHQKIVRTKIVNCTAGGAKISGIEWKPFDEATAHLSKSPPFFESIAAFKKDFSPSTAFNAQEIRGCLNDYKNSLKDFLHRLRQNSANEKSIQTLREDQLKLNADPKFHALGARFLGFKRIEFEEEWFRARNTSLEAQAQTLQNWSDEVLRILDELERLLPKA